MTCINLLEQPQYQNIKIKKMIDEAKKEQGALKKTNLKSAMSFTSFRTFKGFH